MNEFREWLSDNLRYIILGCGVLIILGLLFVGFRFLTSIIDATQGNNSYVNNEQPVDPDDTVGENTGDDDDGNGGTENDNAGENTGSGDDDQSGNTGSENPDDTENQGGNGGSENPDDAENQGGNADSENPDDTENQGGNAGSENPDDAENQGGNTGSENPDDAENQGGNTGSENPDDTENQNGNTGNDDDSKDSPLEYNKYSNVNTLVKNYYEALSARDVSSLKALLDVLSAEDEHAILNSDYIERYSDIEVYTKPGLSDGSYVVFVCYGHKYVGYETVLPGMSYVYVETKTDGSLQILSKLTEEQEQHVTEMLNAKDTQKLLKDTQKLYDETLQKDTELKTYLSSLGVV